MSALETSRIQALARSEKIHRPATPVRIVPVHTRTLMRTFVELPWRIYDGDPNWIPPVKNEMLKQTDPRKNVFFRYAVAEHFIALSARGEPLGRIAACIHPMEGGRPATEKGAFGFFEAVPDADVARSLLSAAETWLRERGMKWIAGPYNYCVNEEFGLLVSGFDAAPAFCSTYNPPYYRDLIEDCGYAIQSRYATFGITRKDGVKIAPAIQRRGQDVINRLGLRVRPIDMKAFEEEIETLRLLFNEAFASHPDIVPVPRDLFYRDFAWARSYIDPRWVRLVEHDGKPVAFSFIMPDVNEIIRWLNGNLRLWHYPFLPGRIRGVRRAIVLMIGALPAAATWGVGRVLAKEIVEQALACGFEELQTTWIREENWQSHALVHCPPFRELKRYVILGKALV